MFNLPNGMNLNTKHGESLLIRIFISLVGSLSMTNSVNSNSEMYKYVRCVVADQEMKKERCSFSNSHTHTHARTHYSLEKKMKHTSNNRKI